MIFHFDFVRLDRDKWRKTDWTLPALKAAYARIDQAAGLHGCKASSDRNHLQSGGKSLRKRLPLPGFGEGGLRALLAVTWLNRGLTLPNELLELASTLSWGLRNSPFEP